MKQALDGLRCQGSHEHVPCAGSETARSAYPEQLCNAIHDGLDAHESAHAMPATGTHAKPFEALVPGCMSVPGECTRGLTSRPEMAVEVGPHVAHSVAEPFVGRDKVSLADPPSPKVIEPSVGRDGDVDIEDPCWQLFCLEHGIDPALAAWSFADRPEMPR